jgi:dephospho-CoA kinase
MRAVICLSGGIAAGKTTVAQALVEHFSDAAVRSFGDVVRHHAREQGKPLDRATLQTVGLALVEAGWRSFVDVLLYDIPQRVQVLIIEGIRHRKAVEEIRRRHLSDISLLVYLKIDSRVQEIRLNERGESPSTGLHAVESSLAEVEAIADLVIDGNLPPNQIIDSVLDAISHPRGRG